MSVMYYVISHARLYSTRHSHVGCYVWRPAGEGAGEGAYQRAARGPSVNQVQVA